MRWDLGAIWRTGDWSRDAKVKEFFGLTADQHIARVYLCWLILKPQLSLLRAHHLKIEQFGWDKWITAFIESLCDNQT